MAAGDGHVTNNFKEQLLLNNIDCVTDTFKLALFDIAYSAGQIDGAPAYGSSPYDANEASGSGYTAGGESIGTPVVTQDDTNDWAKWDDDGTDVTWTALAANNIQQAILYSVTTSNLVCIIWEIGTNSNGGDYTIQFHTNGMMTLA